MTSVKSRLERLEKEQRFQRWFETHDILERFTDDELKTYAQTGELPESVLCASFGDRPSRLRGLDRKTLLQMWEERERLFGGRSDDELEFYTEQGYWPEQPRHQLSGSSHREQSEKTVG